MFFRHLHITGLIPYTTASKIQDSLVAKLLAHKANPATIPPPDPTIITAQFEPVYTCGRREIHTVSQEQQAYLTSPTPWGEAAFHPALRGGQTTFHGPGQLTAYPILDLKHHRLSPRCYIHALEAAVMSTCATYGITTTRTENPGVWLPDGSRKICAVGVHLRRNVTSHGVGLNVSTELGWFGRIVACGLEGKGTTSLVDCGASVPGGVEEVAEVFVKAFGESLDGVDCIVKAEEEVVDIG